ncbi:MAG: carboxypeptidase-like regulatory domain-containing protein [Acidobacteriota bacterium]
MKNLAVIGLLLLALGTLPAAASYRDGEAVRVTGIVTDAAGKPLPGVRVVLEASRSRVNLRRLSREKRDSTRLTAVTDERGEYSIEWHWHRYYNAYELIVGVAVRKPAGERLQALETLDISRRLEKSNPLVVPIVIEDAEFVQTLQRFVAGIRSDDERRIYAQMGKPDEVKERVSSSRKDTSWWYFESGKVFRFTDGELVGEESFTPVEAF